MPAAGAGTDTLATPLFSAAQPTEFVPSKNCTRPIGVVVPEEGDTLALRTVFCPCTALVGFTETVVLVAVCDCEAATEIATSPELEPLSAALP
jgi:hypothetical protein